MGRLVELGSLLMPAPDAGTEAALAGAHGDVERRSGLRQELLDVGFHTLLIENHAGVRDYDPTVFVDQVGGRDGFRIADAPCGDWPAFIC